MTIVGENDGATLPRSFRFRGRDVVVGGALPATFLPRFSFHDFLDKIRGLEALPTPPDATTYRTAASAALATMLGNAAAGCCVEACDLHLDATRAANAGTPYVPTDAQCLGVYSAVTGYVPGNAATDLGTDPSQLDAWRAKNPYPSGATFLGSASVDGSQPAHVKLAAWLFEGARITMCLPDEWESEEDEGDTWDVAGPPVPRNGHCVDLVDYDADGVWICTWGEIIRLTWAALAMYAVPSAGGSVAVILASDVVARATSKAPNGLDLSTLQADLGRVS
jgi:hypothetical protein